MAGGPELAREYPYVFDNPLVFFPGAAALLVLVMLPVFFYCKRRHGWHNACRIVFVTLFVAAAGLLGLLRAAEWAYDHGLWPTMQPYLADLVLKAKPRYDDVLRLVAVFVLRLFLFEIFIFSAIQGYVAMRAFKLPNPATQLGGESGFVRSTLMIAQVVHRIVLLLENMLRGLIVTVIELGHNLARVLVAFLREIFLPALAAASACGLLALLAVSVRGYLDGEGLRMLLRIFGSLAGILLCVMVLIGAISHYRPRRVAAFHLEFIGFLLPNLLVFSCSCQFAFI